MGRIRTFDIVVDNNAAAEVRGVPVYRPGGHVTGVVHLTLNTPQEDVGEISIKLQGQAKTNWSEIVRSRTHVLGDQPVTFTGTETYIDEKISLWKPTHAHQRLNRGPSQFPFQFQIPNENLPPAYEGTSGSVWYRLKCEISGESSLSYAKTAKTIGIAGRPLDLNSVPSAMLPIHGESESVMSSLCCITGSIKVQASADKRAYIPGETAYITAIIYGSSGTRYEVDLKLVEEATYRGTGSIFTSPGVSVTRPGSCQRLRVIFRKRTSGMLQRQGQTTLQREPLIIPDFKPIVDSGFQGCSLIDINYYISVNPILSRLSRTADTEVLLPVTVGRIPFTALPSYHVSTSQLPHPSEPPPSYEAATAYRQDTPQQPTDTAFVNQAYSPLVDDAPPTAPRDRRDSIAEPSLSASSSRCQVPANQSASSQSGDQPPSRPTPPRPPPVIPPPGFRSHAGSGVRGVDNSTFSRKVRTEEDSPAEGGRGESTSRKTSSSVTSREQDDIVQLEDDVLHTPLPPPALFSSPTEDASRESPVNTNQDGQLRGDGTRGPSQDERRDRASSQDSLTVPYFLPAYERQLLGRLTSEDDTEEEEAKPVGVRMRSFFLPMSQESDSVRLLDSEPLADQTEVTSASMDWLPPSPPWEDEPSSLKVCEMPSDDASGAEESAQVPTSEEVTTTSVSETQMSAPHVIKTDAWDGVTSDKDEGEDDTNSNKIHNPDVSNDEDSAPSETSFVPIHSPATCTATCTQIQDLNRAGPSSDFAGVPFPESTDTSPAKTRRPAASPQRSDGPPSREFHSTNLGKQWSNVGPPSPPSESLSGNVRAVGDTARQHSRTPSPYFHPDDGRRDRDDTSSVSSFGSYSPSAQTPTEIARRSDRKEDRSRAWSSSHPRGRDWNTLPTRSRASSGGLRESALGSLNRQKRSLKHSTSHPSPNQNAGWSSSDRRKGSRKQRVSTLDLRSRDGPRNAECTVSLPATDSQSTASPGMPTAPVRLGSDANRSRSQANTRLHPSNRTQLSSQVPHQDEKPAPSSRFILADAPNKAHNISRENTEKRSSYTSAIGNRVDDIAPSAHSPRRFHRAQVANEERPKKMKSCLAYHYLDYVEDEGDEIGPDKHRLETFV